MNSTISQDSIKEMLLYRGGRLFWKVSRTHSVKIGDEAGYTHKCKGEVRRLIGLNNKDYYTHRLIFLYHHGYLPKMIDHIDGDPLNNDIGNLRACTNGQNKQNCKIHKNNKSGVKGVFWNKFRNRWQSQIMIEGKIIYLGRFIELCEAKKVVQAKRIELHKEFANHGEVA